MEAITENADLDGYLLQKKIELIIDMNNKKFVAELNNVHALINKLSEEIAEIKKKVNNAQKWNSMLQNLILQMPM